jgi:aspartate kinase
VAVTLTDRDVHVCKFGGTSLGDGPRIRQAARLAAGAEGAPVVVVSAMSRATDVLEGLAEAPPGSERDDAIRAFEERHHAAGRHLLGADYAESALRGRIAERMGALRRRLDEPDRTPAPNPVRRDEVVATGEDLSAALMAAALQSEGLDGRVVDAREVIRTDARFGRAVPDDEATVRLVRERLASELASGRIPVLQGFVGATHDGRTTTLGRGGSDFTAAIVGAALGAREVTIWTDVDGVFSADPATVPGARVLPELGYEEAVELAYFGARVIHPAAAKHAAARAVALRIRNTLRPDAAGTLVRPDRRATPGVAALAYKSGIALITVRSRPMFMAYGFLARVFEVLSRHGVPVDLVATSHTSTAFTVDRAEELGAVRVDLEIFAEVEVREGLGTVSAVGAGLLVAPGITGEIFRILGHTPILLISQATDTSLSFVVSEKEGPGVVGRLHKALLETGDEP